MTQYTLIEAGKILGIGAEAVRARVKRGTIPAVGKRNGRTIVEIPEDQLPKRSAVDTTAPDTRYVRHLEQEVETLRSLLAQAHASILALTKSKTT